jgi:hypothetical protein
MVFFIVKVVTTALVVAAVSEVAKKFPLLGAMIVSFPMISIMTFIWIYVDTKDVPKLVVMSRDIFWLVVPSLLFFLVFPVLLSRGVHFVWALVISCAVMSAGYAGYAWILKRIGIQ